ncbi:MAG: response regulator [Alphaproteobacteria bacterium]|nr:response regulator [Alphaproteobacteria bacterium]
MPLPDDIVRVLIVEDNPGDAYLIEHLLQDARSVRVEATTVQTVADALEAIEHDEYSLVFTDLDLPDSFGLQTVERMLGNARGLPVVVLSGADARQTALDAIRMGAQDFLEKGLVTATALDRTLAHSLERHSINRALRSNLQDLELANRQFVKMISDLSDAVVIVEPGGMVLFVNPAAEDLFDRAAGDMIGNPLGLPIDSHEPVEIELSHRSGEVLTAEIRIVDTEWDGKPALVASLRDITERKRAERAMQVAQQAAEAASEMKTRFLANMSHELRTPLNSIIGFSEIIKSEQFGPVGTQRYSEYAGDIHHSGRHLLSLINDLLDLSKAEADSYEIVDHRFDLVQAVRDAVRLVAPQAEAKSQTVEIQSVVPQCDVVAGERQITQVVVNLLSNAIKFTPEGGLIGIRIRPSSLGSVAVDVVDNGIGVDPAEIPRLFTAYTQVGEPYLKQDGQGTGLGLALTKRLIELHGGFVRMQSTLGGGTTVSFVLPGDRVCRAEDTHDLAMFG